MVLDLKWCDQQQKRYPFLPFWRLFSPNCFGIIFREICVCAEETSVAKNWDVAMVQCRSFFGFQMMELICS